MLAIAGGKGGCGKTTTALGLAAALARNGATPTVVDADRDAPNVHLLTDATLPDRADSNGQSYGESLESATVETNIGPGVSVIPAPSGTISNNRFQAALDRFASQDSPVLVDCPAGAGRDAVAPLRASDEVLLVTTLAPASLRDAAKTAAMADRLGIDIVGTVLTRVPTWASATSGRDTANSDSVEGTIRPDIRRRIERLLDSTVIGHVPEVERSGRAVIDHPVVRTAYERLSLGIRR